MIMKKFLLASAIFIAFASTAEAYTWEVQRCAELYMQRNRFYNNKGLCFTRDFAKEQFPENKFICTVRDAKNLPITANEKAWVDRIVAIENAIGCPKL
jgi:hypothetical protein